MKSYRKAFWVLAFVGLVLDLGSKYGIFAHLYNDGAGGQIEVISGAFDIVARFTPNIETGDDILARLRMVSGKHIPYVNHGALFGIGAGHNLIFAGISIAAALGIIYCSTRNSVMGDRLLCLALGLILAGTLGNLYDRVVFNGVRDFLYWHGGVDWPVFNIADCCLVCGATTLLVQAFFLPEPLPQGDAQSVAQEPHAVSTEQPVG